MHGITEERRHSPVGRKQKTYQSHVCINASLMLPPCTAPSIQHTAQRAQSLACATGSVFGVCGLTGAQQPSAAVLKPTVADPQKSLPAGDVRGGGLCRQRWGGGPLTWVLARWGRQPRQTAPCLLRDAPPQFYQPRGPQRRGGEVNGGRTLRMNTMKGLTRSGLTAFTSFIFRKDLSSPSCMDLFTLQPQHKPFQTVCGARLYWPSVRKTANPILHDCYLYNEH